MIMDTQTRARYEYKVMNTGHFKQFWKGNIDNALNAMGADGWRLVGMTSMDAGGMRSKEITQYVFERQI
jgi:hypothetical protein